MGCGIPGCGCGKKKSVMDILDRLEAKRVTKHAPPEAGLGTQTDKKDPEPPKEQPKDERASGG